MALKIQGSEAPVRELRGAWALRRRPLGRNLNSLADAETESVQLIMANESLFGREGAGRALRERESSGLNRRVSTRNLFEPGSSSHPAC